MISFQYPILLAILLAVYGFLAYWRWRTLKRKRDKKASLILSNPLFLSIKPNWRARVAPKWEILRWIALFLLTVGLGGPRFNFLDKELYAHGIDIITALDISSSMDAEDLKPNRLNAARENIKNFVKKRKYDRIGLVLFGKNSHLQCPVTLDHEILNYFMDNLYINEEMRSQTAIGSAITTSLLALNAVKENNHQNKSKIIILVTDGENTGGNVDPITAAELAQSLEVKIYTVGIGKAGISHVFRKIANAVFGGKSSVPFETVMNEETLKKIAEISNGKYYNAQTENDMEKIFAEIDQLEKKEIPLDKKFNYKEKHFAFIASAFFLFLLEIFGKITLFRSLPQ